MNEKVIKILNKYLHIKNGRNNLKKINLNPFSIRVALELFNTNNIGKLINGKS